MNKKDIEEFIKSKNIRIQNCNYNETLELIKNLSEDISLVPYFKEIDKDNIDYLTSEFPIITLT
nr:hypothetical protein [Clostridioides sp.]